MTVDIVHSDEIGRVVVVHFETKRGPHSYYVAHSWNNDDHTAFSIEGQFNSLDDALAHLFNL